MRKILNPVLTLMISWQYKTRSSCEFSGCGCGFLLEIYVNKCFHCVLCIYIKYFCFLGRKTLCLLVHADNLSSVWVSLLWIKSACAGEVSAMLAVYTLYKMGPSTDPWETPGIYPLWCKKFRYFRKDNITVFSSVRAVHTEEWSSLCQCSSNGFFVWNQLHI